MTERPPPTPEQLERELHYYRSEYNDLGARMVRMQEQQSKATREARRSKLVAKLVREAYAIGSWDLTEDQVGEPILAIVADNSICDQAIFFAQDSTSPAIFRVEHSQGAKLDRPVVIADPPAFFFTSSKEAQCPAAAHLSNAIGVPFLLWAHNSASGRALLLGKRTEGNIHRPFEAGDQEIVEGCPCSL